MQSLSRKNIDYLGTKQNLISLPGILLVLIVHGVLFYVLWNQRVMPHPEQLVTLFADVISLPQPEPQPEVKPEPAKLQPIQKPEPKPKVKQLATKAPEISKPQPVALPEPEPAVESTEQDIKPVPVTEAPTKPQMPAGPVTLTSELSVSCPSLTAPTYPAISRRMGEEGKLILRVELDESGRIENARVVDSSGYDRLDNAALDAVKSWQCRPAMRNGEPVRAVALQPFNFVLQGN